MPDTLAEAVERRLLRRPRMSFQLTHNMVRKRIKRCTRRVGWYDLTVGDYVIAVEKAQGLKKGSRTTYLATIVIKSVRREPLKAMTDADCAAEGYPEMNRFQFMDMFVRNMKCKPDDDITRIEFDYLDERDLTPFLAEIREKMQLDKTT